jgi:hypothetical protein
MRVIDIPAQYRLQIVRRRSAAVSCDDLFSSTKSSREGARAIPVDYDTSYGGSKQAGSKAERAQSFISARTRRATGCAPDCPSAGQHGLRCVVQGRRGSGKGCPSESAGSTCCGGAVKRQIRCVDQRQNGFQHGLPFIRFTEQTYADRHVRGVCRFDAGSQPRPKG